MAKALKEMMSNFITKWLEDFFVFLGLGIVIFTTYKSFGITAGNYSLGIVLLLFGLLIAKR